MEAGGRKGGRHRLGTPGLVHCVRHKAVTEALAEYRRGWLAAVLVPAKHSIAGLRKRAARAASESAWAPVNRAQTAS